MTSNHEGTECYLQRILDMDQLEVVHLCSDSLNGPDVIAKTQACDCWCCMGEVRGRVPEQWQGGSAGPSPALSAAP